MKRYFVGEGYDEMMFKDFLVVDEDKLIEVVEDKRWYDYTEELEGMVAIDRKVYKTGYDTLYETRDGSKTLVYTSYKQGKEVIAFLPPDIETVDHAREYIYQQELEFFGTM